MFLIIILLIVGIGLSFHFFYTIDKTKTGCSLGLFVEILVILVLFFLTVLSIYYTAKSETVKYHVLVDPDVPFVEMYNNYNIEKQNGDVFIVTPKIAQ